MAEPPVCATRSTARRSGRYQQLANRDDAFVSVVLGVERVAREILLSGESLVDDWLTSRLLRRRVFGGSAALRRIGLYAGPIDGIPGHNTEAAVISFQRRVGIKVDAMIGPEVIRRLEENPSLPTDAHDACPCNASRDSGSIAPRRAHQLDGGEATPRCPSGTLIARISYMSELREAQT
jgi:hypothetical protein